MFLSQNNYFEPNIIYNQQRIFTWNSVLEKALKHAHKYFYIICTSEKLPYFKWYWPLTYRKCKLFQVKSSIEGKVKLLYIKTHKWISNLSTYPGESI